MQTECETVRRLTVYSTFGEHTDPLLAGLARSALSIIHDAREDGMTEHDLHYLQILVDVWIQDGQEDLLPHLQSGAPDCELCAALADHVLCKDVAP